MRSTIDEARRRENDSTGIDFFEFLYEIWRARFLVAAILLFSVLTAAGLNYYQRLNSVEPVAQDVKEEVVPPAVVAPTPAEAVKRYRAEYWLDNDKELNAPNPAALVMRAAERGFRALGLSPRHLGQDVANAEGAFVYRILDGYLAPQRRGYLVLEFPDDLEVGIDRVEAALQTATAQQTRDAVEQARIDIATLNETFELLATARTPAGETLQRNLYLAKRLIEYAERKGPSFQFVTFSEFVPWEISPAPAAVAASEQSLVADAAALEAVERAQVPSQARERRRLVIAALVGAVMAVVVVMFRIAIERNRRRPAFSEA